MSIKSMGAAVLLLLAATLSACSGSPDAPKPTKPGHHFVIVDVSTSPATMNDPTVVKASETWIGNDMKKNVALGDTITVYEAGALSAKRLVAHPPIVTDYNLRIDAAHAQVVQQMREIVARFKVEGGDDATNLLATMESIRPECAPRSTITLFTDGVEASADYSAARALDAGKPVDLPPPSGKFLAGCRVRLVGFGLTTNTATGQSELLPSHALSALRLGWVNWLQAAGVRFEDVAFISAL